MTVTEPLPPADVLALLLRERRSVRAFLPRPVERALIERLLAEAALAPSGVNLQPWQVHVLTGVSLRQVVQRAQAIHHDPEQAAQLQAEYRYYPAEWKPAYAARRRKIGLDLYELLGIAKGDKARMHEQHGRNYAFFGAPVGLLFTIDRSLTQGSWLDCGMFMQNLMLAARAHGLDSCVQAAWIHYHAQLAEWLDLPPEQMLLCGMALGYADPSAPENRLTTERAAVAEFTTFHE